MNKKALNQKLLFIVPVGIVFFCIMVFIVVRIVTEVYSTQKNAEKYIGKIIVVDKDTTMVVNYYITSDSYMLSNKVQVSSAFVEQQLNSVYGKKP